LGSWASSFKANGAGGHSLRGIGLICVNGRRLGNVALGKAYEVTWVRFGEVRLVGRARVGARGLAALAGKAVAKEKMLIRKRVALRSKGGNATRESFIVDLDKTERMSVQDAAQSEARGFEPRSFP